MDKTLRAILEEKYGLAPAANEQAAEEFYARLSLDEKGKIGVELGKRGYGDTTRPDDVLTVRSTVDAPPLDFTTRGFHVGAESANDDTRSVEAVIATDTPVAVYDYRSGEMIDEVLRMDGVEVDEQVPMLANHSRWSLDDVYGSTREINTAAHELRGRLYFAEGDEGVERAWQKVRGGHIRDVSVGYRAEKYTDIRPGQTAVVNGQTYRAKGRTLRITTRWTLREVSLVPIGADSHSKIRADLSSEGKTMPKELRTYLESLGLRTKATATEAQEYLGELEGEDAKRAAEIQAEIDKRKNNPLPDVPTLDVPMPPATTPRSEIDKAVKDALDKQAAADVARASELTELAGDDVPADLLRKAIVEKWDAAKAGAEFLRAVRQRGPDGEPARAPAQHSRSHDADCNVRSLAAGMLSNYGMDPTDHVLHRGDRDPRRRDGLTEQDADRGDSFRGMSAVDLCRECVRMDSGRVTHNREETIRAAVSGTSLSAVFTTNVYAHLLVGWETVGDTTKGWVDEEDVENFLDQEDVTLDVDSKLERLPSGDTAKHATASDSSETYRIARYAKQFVVDEQTLINDRLNAIMRMPGEMGENARSLRPDLIYALMNENPTMSDTGAVFNATVVTTTGGHANLTTAAIGAEGLRAAISAMAIQRLGQTGTEPGDALNIRANYLIAPPQLKWTVLALLKSGELQKVFADSPDSEFANINLLALEGIKPVFDSRLDDVGVRDPKTKAVRTGSLTNWFLAEGKRRGLRVAYRTGTNRLPSLRSFALSQGQWGIGWDINMDIGAAFNEYRTWHKSTGSG
ncbi:hypothetical protein LCGC14_1276310 [marine sediment metagenome]|uniref:Prohead serine protease domain-containing protein n=1 Tax=marine sediment metagenome TaxID=412755 RepID=A0A0F9KYA8_9ZZZZ